MDALQSSPPKSLHQLCSTLLDELARVRAQLDSLEFEFYSQDAAVDGIEEQQENSDAAYAFICRWAPVAKEVMQCHSLTELNSMRQMQSAIVLGRDPELRELQPDLKHIGPETCVRLTRLQNRLLAYVPSRFTGMIDTIGGVQALCDKYLLSFYTLDYKQAPVETAKKYTMNRREWNSRARDCLKNALYNPHLFLRDCLRLGRMEKSTLGLLNRADILTAPVVGLFTDECEQIRAALDALEEWIEHDKGYANFIATDLAELEKRRNNLRQRQTELRHQLHTSQFRTKSLQVEKARLQVELTSLADKHAELLQAEEQLYQEVNSAKINCEIKEFRREEIKRAARERAATATGEAADEPELDPMEAQTLLKELKEQLRLLRHTIPQMERRMTALRSKLGVIEDKQRRFVEASDALKDSERETIRLRNEASNVDYQLEQCQKSLDQCALIYRLKTAADTTSKVYHEMPLETRAAQEAKTQKMLHNQQRQQQQGSESSRSEERVGIRLPPINQTKLAATAVATGTARPAESVTDSNGSPFDRVCLLISRRIESDWKRLYRALPFVPQRGRETIDRDLEELQTGLVGESRAQCAWRALHRWRRFHRRAKPTELRAALARLRRADLLLEVDACLAPPAAPTVVKETPLPANIDKELVPFYRQVERYDNLVLARRSREIAKT